MIIRIWLLVFLLSVLSLAACSSSKQMSVAMEDSDYSTIDDEDEISPTLAEIMEEMSKRRNDAHELLEKGDAAGAQEQLERALNIMAANELESPDLYTDDRKYKLLAEGVLADYKSLMKIQSPLDDYSQHHESLSFEWDRGPHDSSEDLKPVNSFPLVRNSRVEKWIKYFTTGRGRKTFAIWLARGARYRPMMMKILRETGIPEDLYFLSMIESGFNPVARSRARAVGQWQFIYGTGRAYGLKIDYYVDERRDPEKSTRAAARHLRDLYREFHDWNLALSTYNCSKRRVYRVMAQYQTRDYWKLKSLPRETREYVPKFIAAAIIGKAPHQYGFTGIEPLAPIEYEKVRVKGCVDLAVLADCAGSDYATMRILNAELHHGFSPPYNEGYLLKIPVGKKNKFQLAYQKLPESAKAKRAIHSVRKGETLSHIAGRYGTSIRQLMLLNKLKSPNRLSIGQNLFVPVTSASSRSYAANQKSRPSARKSVEKSRPPVKKTEYAMSGNSQRTEYRVKKGDNVGQIAEKYGVRAQDIRSWNGLRYGQYIYPGQMLTVYSKENVAGNSSRKKESKVLATNIESGSSNGNSKVYIVRKGDTLWNIARIFGVPLKIILQTNRMHKRSIIKPGDQLLIPA